MQLSPGSNEDKFHNNFWIHIFDIEFQKTICFKIASCETILRSGTKVNWSRAISGHFSTPKALPPGDYQLRQGSQTIPAVYHTLPILQRYISTYKHSITVRALSTSSNNPVPEIPDVLDNISVWYHSVGRTRAWLRSSSRFEDHRRLCVT